MAERRLVAIPARTEAARCRSCNAWIYWVRTHAGGRLPVSVDREVPGHAFPTYNDAGAGHAHFADCPDAKNWRRPKNRGAR